MSAKSVLGHRPGETPHSRAGVHKVSFPDGRSRIVLTRQLMRAIKYRYRQIVAGKRVNTVTSKFILKTS